MSVAHLRGDLHERIIRGLLPLNRVLTRFGVVPNQVTVAAMVFSLAAAGLIVADQLVLAGVVWLLGGLLDLIDGALARLQDRVTASGAFLDSTLDRVSEGVVFSALAYHLAAQGAAVDAGLVVLALLGSLLISYTRARAEGLGADCKVGLVTRAERVLLIAFGLCFDQVQVVIYLLVLLTAFTVGQRIHHTFRVLHEKG
jgi:CDP-diacylglycerol--glycerol-3-phosphate 3-phosphatidyltransferase